MLAMTRRAWPIRQAGVTLLELAIVIAIIGVLATAAVPSIVDRWQRETVILLAERFASAVSVAQETAQYRHVPTQLRPTKNPASGQGESWMLTMAPSPPASGASSATEDVPVLAITLPTMPTVKITPSNMPNDTLSYSSVGYLQTSSPLFGATLKISSGRHQRLVRINNAGRARICNPDTDGDSCKPTGDDTADS
ncbi:GspH/FimT family pseudopilin [Ralstonia insidiosa]|uniref:GspH/FimT family pseudopilin n=1 Tax=Ralstonia insidiosa TaxID=190721 RepID=UPI001FC93870|nr:GspH/FimT family pseudopilin [Ralstonia insidiosa]